jgi:rubrerythrin
MSDKPSYLGLLNAIAVGEQGGETLLDAWAAATPNPAVRATMEAVALREGEHAKSFAKRINELGYSVIPKEDPGLAARCEIAGSTTLTDCEKFERLGYKRVQETTDTDVFSKFFDDVTMDVRTGELMGRYISEERDSVRMLRACYNAVASEDTSSADTSALEARLDRIESALAELAAATVGTSDGKVKAKR